MLTLQRQKLNAHTQILFPDLFRSANGGRQESLHGKQGWGAEKTTLTDSH